MSIELMKVLKLFLLSYLIISFTSCSKKTKNTSENKLLTFIHTKTDVKLHNYNPNLNLPPPTEKSDSELFYKAIPEIIKAIEKYPEILIKSTLKRVYIYKTIFMNNIFYAGTYYFTYGKDENEIYITYRDGIEYIESVFHHEYFSLLMKIYGYNVLNEKKWHTLNPPDFKYWDRKKGQEYLKIYKTSQPSFDTTYLAAGFLSRYSLTSADNDMSRFAENLFLGKKEFWDAYFKYPRIKNKTDFIINTYKKIHPAFNYDFFYNLYKKSLLPEKVN